MMLRLVTGAPGFLVGVGAAAVLAPALVVAQPVDPGRDQEAREHFQVGREAFSRGEFERAARAFERAHELSQRSQILYNIGAAYERLHRWQQAHDAFRAYLDANPEAPDRAEVEARLRVIDEELSREPATSRVVVVERPVVVRPVVPEDPPRPWRTVAIVTGISTVVVGGITLGIGLLADSRYNTLLQTCGEGAPPGMYVGCRQDDLDDLNLRAAFVNVGIVTTGVLAASTVVAYILDLARPRERAPAPTTTPAPTDASRRWPRLGVAPTPGGSVVTLGGVF